MALVAEPDPPPAAPARRARLADWGWSRVRWLAAELTVVAAGILIALAVQSRVDERDDRDSEREYLLQLQADLRETERAVMRGDSVHRTADRAGAMLLHAFFTAERPPRDSLLLWAVRASSYEAPRPVLGTAEALVSTGDLALVRDHGLRFAVTAYLEESRTLTAEQFAVEEVWVRAAQQLRRALDFSEGLELMQGPRVDSLARANPLSYLPAGPRRRPFPVDAETFLSNRDAYDGVADMYWGKWNMAQLHASMLQDARELRARVEAALKK
jgi:hypothetical protein